MNINNQNVAKMPSPNASDSASDHGETCKFNYFEVIDNEVNNYLMLTQPSTPEFYKLTQNSTNYSDATEFLPLFLQPWV